MHQDLLIYTTTTRQIFFFERDLVDLKTRMLRLFRFLKILEPDLNYIL